MVHYFKWKDRVILTEAGLKRFSPDIQEKIKGVLFVAEINGNLIKVISPETRKGVEVHYTNLLAAR